MTALALRQVAKRYAGGDRPALSGFDLDVPQGQFLCIVGPSGSGKTTLLNILAGLDTAWQGSVDRDPAARIGMLFQSPRLMPWLTVIDNVRLVAVDDEARARARSMIAEMDLAGWEMKYPRQLSGGMQRRAALARALLPEPDLLLLDEPFVSLDRPVADRLRALLVSSWERRRPTVVFVTHDLAEALRLADRIVFLSPSPGRVVLDWPVASPRPPAADADRIAAAAMAEILALHPDLLAGLAAVDAQEDKA
jgi:ABC-type nitrate/sulfonate/bicarbonate transport system ATPase subunit